MLDYVYKSVIQPVLDYASCVWDPKPKVHQQHLENVQRFASRVASNQWHASPTTLVGRLGWPLLHSRREYMKLCVCDRILREESLIPSSVFVRHPRPSRSHRNRHPLFYPRVATNHHRHSYFVSVIPVWNSLPDAIVFRGTHASFKRALRLYTRGPNSCKLSKFQIFVCCLWCCALYVGGP